jgi:ankyrin repeat protein
MSFMERLQSAMILKTSMYHPFEAHIVEHSSRSFLVAIQTGRKSTAETMILDGFDVNRVEGTHAPALIHAIKHERSEIAAMLIEYGANVNIRDHNGETPLHIAVKIRMNELIHLLMRYGADNSLNDKYGISPLEISRQQNNKAAQQILTGTEPMPIKPATLFQAALSGDLQALLAVNASLHKLFDRNKRFQSLLHAAVHGGNIKLICYLLNKGLNIDAVDRNGDPAAHCRRHERSARYS